MVVSIVESEEEGIEMRTLEELALEGMHSKLGLYCHV